jgi:hypothetical protein
MNKFSKNEKLLIFVCIIFSLVSLILLNLIRPRIELGVTNPIAIIKIVENNVKHKDSREISFFDVAQDFKVQNNDQIITGKNSKAIVRFLKSNNQVYINESSLIQIADEDVSESEFDVEKSNVVKLLKGNVIIEANSGQKIFIEDPKKNKKEVHEKISISIDGESGNQIVEVLGLKNGQGVKQTLKDESFINKHDKENVKNDKKKLTSASDVAEDNSDQNRIMAYIALGVVFFAISLWLLDIWLSKKEEKKKKSKR